MRNPTCAGGASQLRTSTPTATWTSTLQLPAGPATSSGQNDGTGRFVDVARALGVAGTPYLEGEREYWATRSGADWETSTRTRFPTLIVGNLAHPDFPVLLEPELRLLEPRGWLASWSSMSAAGWRTPRRTPRPPGPTTTATAGSTSTSRRSTRDVRPFLYRTAGLRQHLRRRLVGVGYGGAKRLGAPGGLNADAFRTCSSARGVAAGSS